jgi:hypothetical protein
VLSRPRGPTSRYELRIDWDHPVLRAVANKDSRSRGVQARRALSREDALAAIAGEDPRPLLVLRECFTCNGTDDALLTRQADNERTLLMSRWFHCVKLPADVLEDDHPFRALFAAESPGHLFVSRADGAERADLDGQQSRTELWKIMGARLKGDYESSFEPSLKKLLRLLEDYDRADQAIAQAKEAIDEAMEEGLSAKKLEKLQDKLADLEERKTKARAEALRHSALALRPPRPAAPSDDQSG